MNIDVKKIIFIWYEKLKDWIISLIYGKFVLSVLIMKYINGAISPIEITSKIDTINVRKIIKYNFSFSLWFKKFNIILNSSINIITKIL